MTGETDPENEKDITTKVNKEVNYITQHTLHNMKFRPNSTSRKKLCSENKVH